MLFNSVQFGVFLFSVILLFHLFKKKETKLFFLLAASYLFYFFDSGWFVVLLLYSSLLDFFVGKKLAEAKGKRTRLALMWTSVVGNLAVLVYFKYTHFFAGLVGVHVPWRIILPVGISFYTFQSMSYTLDIYRGKLKPIDSFLKFTLYVAFFPQLLAGPIVRAREFLPQLSKKIMISTASLKPALTLIGFGLVKKLVIADNMAPMVNEVLNSPELYPAAVIIVGALAFGVQIYCDFSGYTDIAIGLARIFGLNLPMNFRAPYLSTSPREFWRRWHISLSTWLRDYLYIPLGGNKKGKIRTGINLMITMLLGGLWHGAGLHFVLWGAYHGVLLFVQNIFSSLCKTWTILKTKLGRVMLIIITQYFIFLGWLMFRIQHPASLKIAVLKYLSLDFSGFAALWEFRFALGLLIIFLVVHLAIGTKDAPGWIAKRPLKYWLLFAVMVWLLLFLFAPSGVEEFIYFQF